MKEVTNNESKIAVVYGGNMVHRDARIDEGAKAKEQSGCINSFEFGADKMDAYDAVAFGCRPGSRRTETAIRAMFSDCEGKLGGRRSHSSDLTDGERRMV